MLETPSWPLLLGLLWFEIIVPVRVLSIDEIELFNHFLYLKPLNSEQIDNQYSIGGARGVMVIAVGNGHGDTSSSPGRDWLHFT